MDWNNKKFLTLKNKWYKKLKDSGFDDVEQDEENLKVSSYHGFLLSHKRNKADVSAVHNLNAAKEEYYRHAGFFLNEYKFENAIDKQIWKLHSEGVSHRNITEVLVKKGVKTYRNAVLLTITRLRVLMFKAAGVLHE